MKILLIFLVVAATCRAQVGETVDVCRKNFGKEQQVLKDKNALLFKKPPYWVSIQFERGRAGLVSYKRIDGAKMPEKEIETLRSANFGAQDGGKARLWLRQEEMEGPGHMVHFTLKTESMYYSDYNVLTGVLELFNQDFADRRPKHAQEEEKKPEEPTGGETKAADPKPEGKKDGEEKQGEAP